MATTTEIDAKPTLLPPPNAGEPPKAKHGGRRDPPGGRPAKPTPAAEPEDRDYQITGDLDFWLKLSNFSSDDWSQHVAYLFRTAPIIDRKQGGRPSHLQKYCSPFEREDIMREHGSGSYRIDLCQINPETGKSFRVAQERFTIVNPKFPPNVPPGDWVDDKSNENWKWGAQPNHNGNGSGGNMYPPGFDMEKVLERQEHGFKMGIELAKQMTPPPAPVKDDTLLLTLLTELIKNRPEPQKPDDTATKALLGFLEKQNDRLAAELQELRKNAAAPVPQKGILEQMKELKPVIAEAVELFTAKNGGEQPWWAAPLQTIMEGVGEAIPSVVDMMKNNQGQQRQQQPNPWQQNQGLPAPQAAAPSQTTTAAPPPPQGTAQPVVDVPPEMTDLQKAAQKWGMFILQIAPQMATNFAADEDGHGGYHFRDWVIRMHGLLAWSGLKREVGPQMLFDMVTQHPKLSADLSPEPERIRFIQEFFTPQDEEPDEDPGDGNAIDLGGEDAA